MEQLRLVRKTGDEMDDWKNPVQLGRSENIDYSVSHWHRPKRRKFLNFFSTSVSASIRDIVFLTIDESHGTSTFEELSELEMRDHKAGRRVRVESMSH